jgi:hypothetical protein
VKTSNSGGREREKHVESEWCAPSPPLWSSLISTLFSIKLFHFFATTRILLFLKTKDVLRAFGSHIICIGTNFQYGRDSLFVLYKLAVRSLPKKKKKVKKMHRELAGVLPFDA